MWKSLPPLVVLAVVTTSFGQTTKPATLHLNLAFETLADAPAKDTTKATISFRAPDQKETEEPASLVAGDNAVDLSLPDGTHYLNIRCPGFAPQHVRVKVEDGQLDQPASNVTLHHTRYVVVNYAFNKKGKRELTGDDVESGKLALTHWAGLPYFREDWQLWQAENDKGGGFGTIPVLEFHRISAQTGFAPAPDNTPFDQLTEAPTPGEGGYKCESREAAAGLILFCRVQGNKGNLGFGKIEVQDVTLTPPKDVKVLSDR